MSTNYVILDKNIKNITIIGPSNDKQKIHELLFSKIQNIDKLIGTININGKKYTYLKNGKNINIVNYSDK